MPTESIGGFSEVVEVVLTKVCYSCGEAMPQNFKIRAEWGSPHSEIKFTAVVCSWVCLAALADKQEKLEANEEEDLEE